MCIKVNYYLLYKEILINIKNELYLILLNVYYKKGLYIILIIENILIFNLSVIEDKNKYGMC